MSTAAARSSFWGFPFLFVLYEVSHYLSNDMYLPALPEMMQALSLSTSEIQLSLTAWFFGQATFPLVVGVLADRYGRRPILLWGGVIYIVSTIACALVNNLPQLLIARFIEGASVATMLVPGYALIHETYSQKEAVRILALMGSISVLAPALGPLLGSFALMLTDWRGIFWLIAIAASISLFAVSQCMPKTAQQLSHTTKINLKTLVRQYARLLSNKKYMLRVSTVGFIFAGFLAWVTASPLLIMESFQYSSMHFGLIQALVFTVYIIGSHLVNYLIAKNSLYSLIRWGTQLGLLAGLLSVVFAWYAPQQLGLFVLFMCAYSLGAALAFAPLNRSVIESSEEPIGVRMALFAVFITAFSALGSAASSVFFKGSLFSLAAILATVMIVSTLLLSQCGLRANKVGQV